jgi:hypothetical protein
MNLSTQPDVSKMSIDDLEAYFKARKKEEANKKRIEALRQTNLRPDVKARRRAGVARANANPETIKHRKEAMKKVAADPKVQAKKKAAMNSPETRAKRKATQSTPEWFAKKSAAQKASNTPEVRAKRAASVKAAKNTEESIRLRKEQYAEGSDYRLRHAAAMADPEVRQRLSAARRAGNAARPLLVCPHCGLGGKSHNMIRYHFDNCKQRTVFTVSPKI